MDFFEGIAQVRVWDLCVRGVRVGAEAVGVMWGIWAVGVQEMHVAYTEIAVR